MTSIQVVMVIEVLRKLLRGIPQMKAGAVQLGLAALVFAASSTVASAAPVFADWGSVVDSTVTGTLNGVNFTVEGIEWGSILDYDLAGADYSGAPGTGSQLSLDYSDTSTWTVTFDSPIAVLYLHLIYWRPDVYSFSQPFTLLSGAATASIDGDTLTQASGYADGVLQFNNVTTLSVTHTNDGEGYMALNFATDEAAVPEPGSLALLGAGCCALFALKRKTI